MLDAMHALVQLAVSVLGIAGGIDLTAPGGTTAALAIAVAAVATTMLLVAVVAISRSAPGGGTPPHPVRAISASAPLVQSDPDAPGHPRPRAPQSAASAA